VREPIASIDKLFDADFEAAFGNFFHNR
jgi:hypothetical protein